MLNLHWQPHIVSVCGPYIFSCHETLSVLFYDSSVKDQTVLNSTQKNASFLPFWYWLQPAQAAVMDTVSTAAAAADDAAAASDHALMMMTMRRYSATLLPPVLSSS